MAEQTAFIFYEYQIPCNIHLADDIIRVCRLSPPRNFQ